jgi:hypothetical protein
VGDVVVVVRSGGGAVRRRGLRVGMMDGDSDTRRGVATTGTEDVGESLHSRCQ